MSMVQEQANVVNFDTAFRAAVQQTSTLAQVRLPAEHHSRIQRATALVLDGGVWIEEDGKTAYVRSKDPAVWYHTNGVCPCEDYQRAPANLCKHRISRGLYLRAVELMAHPQPPTIQEVLEPTPLAPAHGVPAQYITMIQGKPFVRYAGLLALAHEKGLVELTAVWTYNDAELSLAEAVATFKDGGHYRESGDATPQNVTKMVVPHFRRVALTRAKARVLRDALGVEICAVEELGEGE